LNPFCALQGAVIWRAVGVGQKQTHRLHVARVTQFTKLLRKTPAVHDLTQERTKFFPEFGAAARVAAAAFLP
jgi:hypothetical protein